jgi:hypothetical protein
MYRTYIQYIKFFFVLNSLTILLYIYLLKVTRKPLGRLGQPKEGKLWQKTGRLIKKAEIQKSGLLETVSN